MVHHLCIDDDIDTGSLRIFNGTLTEIICSADEPAFRLVTEEGMQYDTEHYSLLPGLFDIEAVVSLDGNTVTVTLFISGTNRSNGVTVMCRDLRGAVFGRTEILFTLVLEFFSKFSHLLIN